MGGLIDAAGSSALHYVCLCIIRPFAFQAPSSSSGTGMAMDSSLEVLHSLLKAHNYEAAVVLMQKHTQVCSHAWALRTCLA